jgi:hypothetical protein
VVLDGFEVTGGWRIHTTRSSGPLFLAPVPENHPTRCGKKVPFDDCSPELAGPPAGSGDMIPDPTLPIYVRDQRSRFVMVSR